jgi:hypothetical protein
MECAFHTCRADDWTISDYWGRGETRRRRSLWRGSRASLAAPIGAAESLESPFLGSPNRELHRPTAQFLSSMCVPPLPAPSSPSRLSIKHIKPFLGFSLTAAPVPNRPATASHRAGSSGSSRRKKTKKEPLQRLSALGSNSLSPRCIIRYSVWGGRTPWSHSLCPGPLYSVWRPVDLPSWRSEGQQFIWKPNPGLGLH